ncbi:MAG: hypothetical protein ACXW0F_04135 [Gaiellaceae bacterium]
MDDERKARQAKNEALARRLNEHIDAATGELDLAGVAEPIDRGEYLCECADLACVDHVTLAHAEYAYARSNPIWFVVTPGHEVVDIETVVRTNERFAIVEKHPGEAAIALATDPQA